MLSACGGNSTSDYDGSDEFITIASHDFESANSVNDWNIINKLDSYIDSSISSTGSSSLYFSNPNPTAGFTQLELIDGIQVEEGKSYELSFAIKLSGEGFSNFWDYYIDVSQGNSLLLDNGFNGEGPSGAISMDWTTRKYYFTAGDNSPVKLIFNSAVTNTWIDDISLKEIVPVASSTNKLTDGFENVNSVINWNIIDEQDAYIDYSTSNTGLASFYFSNPKPMYKATELELIDGIRVETGKSYELSFAIRLSGEGFSSYWDFSFEIEQGNSLLLDDGFNGDGPVDAVFTDWVTKKYYFTADDNTPVKLIFNTGVTNTWVDDITIKEM